jgi:hypothetical protein
VINDINGNPLIYLILSNIQSIQKSGDIIIIDDSSIGSIFLQFKTEYDVNQAFSLLNYVLENQLVNIDTLGLFLSSSLEDNEPPIIYFYETVGNDIDGDFIAFNGATAGVPYNTSDGLTFSTSISIDDYPVISRTLLVDLLIDRVEDNRDGVITLAGSNIVIYNMDDLVISSISEIGTYLVRFVVADLANNVVDINTTINIDVY